MRVPIRTRRAVSATWSAVRTAASRTHRNHVARHISRRAVANLSRFGGGSSWGSSTHCIGADTVNPLSCQFSALFFNTISFDRIHAQPPFNNHAIALVIFLVNFLSKISPSYHFQMFGRIFRFWAWKLHQHLSDLKLIVRSITELRLLNYFRHQNAAIHLLLSVRNWELGIGNWASGIGHRELGIGETGNSGLGIGHELSSKKVKLKITHFIFLLLHYQFPITPI